MDFNKLSKEEKEKARNAYLNNDLLQMKLIHDNNQLSQWTYGCCDVHLLKQHFENAYNDKII